MTGPDLSPLERSIRGIYTNPPLATDTGLCSVCTAPTSAPSYAQCYQCSQHADSGYQLATSVVPLSWAPMSASAGYSGQAYLDLRQYKEPNGSSDQVVRLIGLLLLAFNTHATCLLPQGATPYVLAHVPSTSGERNGQHPIQQHFLSRFRPEIPRVIPEYIGQVGGDRNDRRRLNPNNWRIPMDQVGDIQRALILEDTWVTGGHAQSAAGAFEKQGVRTRIVVLGRALDPSRNDHGSYLRTHADPPPFDINRCPVHRVAHTR